MDRRVRPEEHGVVVREMPSYAEFLCELAGLDGHLGRKCETLNQNGSRSAEASKNHADRSRRKLK